MTNPAGAGKDRHTPTSTMGLPGEGVADSDGGESGRHRRAWQSGCARQQASRGDMRQTEWGAGRRGGRRPVLTLRRQPVQSGSPPAAAPTSLYLLIPASGLLLLGVIYLWLASLPNYYMVPKLHPGRMGHWATVSLGFTLALICGFGCYYAAWRIASHLVPTRRRIMLVFGVAAVLSTVLAFTYPLLSDDMFYGIVGARTFGCYRQNPFAVPPSRFAQDPFLPYAGWRDLTMPYGPLWVVISGLVAKISDRGLLATVLAFKALNVSVFLLTTGLLARLLAKRTPRTALAGLVLWAWNPLVLVEVASSAHNDIVMISLIVAACSFAAARRPTPALLMLALAVAAKYVAILLVPLFAIHFLRRQANWRAGIRVLVPGGIVSLAALAILYVPSGSVSGRSARWAKRRITTVASSRSRATCSRTATRYCAMRCCGVVRCCSTLSASVAAAPHRAKVDRTLRRQPCGHVAAAAALALLHALVHHLAGPDRRADRATTPGAADHRDHRRGAGDLSVPVHPAPGVPPAD